MLLRDHSPIVPRRAVRRGRSDGRSAPTVRGCRRPRLRSNPVSTSTPFGPQPGTSAAEHLSPVVPRACRWGTASKLRAWQAEALEQYFCRRCHATSSPPPRPAPARRPSRCASPPSCGRGASSTASPWSRRPTTSSGSGPMPLPARASGSTRASRNAHGRTRPALPRRGGDLRAGRHAARRCTASSRPRAARSSSSTRCTTAATRCRWGDAHPRGVRAARPGGCSLTGTPFRSDTAPIPFVEYEPDAQGVRLSKTDYTYGYGEALRDGVVRPVMFMVYAGHMRWRTKAGDEMEARLGEDDTKDITAQAWRTALEPDRRVDPGRAARPPTAGSPRCGAASRTPAASSSPPTRPIARAYAAILEEIYRRAATVVLSDETGVEHAHRGVLRRRQALDGGGAHGVRGRRRAAARRRRLRDERLDAAVLRPGRSAASCGPAAAARRRRCSCRTCRGCWRSPRESSSSATTRWTAAGRRRRRRPRRRAARSRRTARRRPPTTLEARHVWRRSGRRRSFDRVLFDGSEFGTLGRARQRRGGATSSASPDCSSPSRSAELLRQRQAATGAAGRGAAQAQPTREAGRAEPVALLPHARRAAVSCSTASSGCGRRHTGRAARRRCTPSCGAYAAARPSRRRRCAQLQARIELLRRRLGSR